MICECYCECEFCALNEDCPSDHFGDGTAFCHSFSCIEEGCKMSICISDEEFGIF